MKLTKTKLKEMIREELLSEAIKLGKDTVKLGKYSVAVLTKDKSRIEKSLKDMVGFKPNNHYSWGKTINHFTILDIKKKHYNEVVFILGINFIQVIGEEIKNTLNREKIK